jgi:hypothetical protein
VFYFGLSLNVSSAEKLDGAVVLLTFKFAGCFQQHEKGSFIPDECESVPFSAGYLICLV